MPANLLPRTVILRRSIARFAILGVAAGSIAGLAGMSAVLQGQSPEENSICKFCFGSPTVPGWNPSHPWNDLLQPAGLWI